MTTRSLKLSIRQYPGEAPELLDGSEPIPPEAQLSLDARAMTWWMVESFQAGWRAGIDGYSKALEQIDWEALATKLAQWANAKAAGLPPVVEHRFVQQPSATPVDMRIVGPVAMSIVDMPERVTRRKVVRDARGLITETVDVAEDIA